jgi:hypothetical protein
MDTSNFDAFWKIYPRREGRLDALKAYTQALKHATADTILAGAQRYAQSCSRDGRERKFQKLPGGWLRAGRWMDELPGVKQTQATDWYSECKAMHSNECGLNRWRHEDRKAIDAMKAERQER